MQISLQSAVCFTTCAAVSAYSAYSNYLSWVSGFAFGIIYGYSSGYDNRVMARAGLDIQSNANQFYETKQIIEERERAVRSLTDTSGYIIVTAINLFALGFISQRIQSPSELGTRLATLFCSGLASLGFGYSVGNLFQLDILRRSENPQIQELLKKAII